MARDESHSAVRALGLCLSRSVVINIIITSLTRAYVAANRGDGSG